MSLTDNIFNKRGTWELFEQADGHDLSTASQGYIDDEGRLWLKMPHSVICTDGRHVLKSYNTHTMSDSKTLSTSHSGFSHGDIFWTITTDKRLVALNLKDGSRVDHTDKLPPLDDAYWLWKSPHKDIIIGIPNCIIRYDGHTARRYDIPSLEGNEHKGKAGSATIAPDGTLWVTSLEGVHHFDGDSATLYERAMFGGEMLWDIRVTEQNGVWIPLSSKVILLHAGTDGAITVPAQDLHFTPEPAIVDDEGNLWGCARSFGAFCFNESGYVAFPFEDTPAASGPHEILQDKTRAFWLIGAGNGICRYNPNGMNPLGRMRIEGTVRTTDGAILLSAASKGLYEYKDHRITKRAREMPCGCTCMALQPESQLTLGTVRIGAVFHDLESKKTTYSRTIDALKPLSGRAIRAVAPDRNGNMWYSTKDNVIRQAKDGLTHAAISDLGLASHYPKLFSDSAGTVWITGDTDDPVIHCTEKGFSEFTKHVSAGSGFINCFYEENEQYVWMGTRKGSVIRCDRNTATFELVMSLGHLVKINNIDRDNHGRLLISTDHGLCISDGSNTYFLTESCKLPSKNILKTWQLADDFILIVTEYGACEYKFSHEHPPSVFVSSLESDEFYTRPKRVSLYEGHTRTTVQLSSLNMKTGPLKYQARLLGYNDTWLDSWHSEINYDRLPLGSYTFEARAVDQDLMTSEETAKIEIEVIRDPRDKAISRLAGELKEAHDFAENIIKSISEAIIVLNADARIVKTSDATLHLLGYHKNELLGRPVNILFPKDTASLYDTKGIEALANKGSAAASETQLKKKDGGALPVLLSASCMHDEKGELRSLVLAASDLTEYKQLQSQMLQGQKLESLGVLAGGIAHDFNNMLAIILGNAELSIAEAPEDSPIHGYLSDAISASEQAAKLCSAMLAYAGREQTFRKALDISQMVEHNASLLKSSISKKIELQYDLAQNLPQVLGDEVQLMQVVMNFITNAAEAIGDEDGTIHLSTSSGTFTQRELSSHYTDITPPAGDYVVMEVKDTGCGMDHQTVLHIFDPFFTTKFTGRGLGLSAVHGIMRSHNAALSVTSAPGQGSSFRIFLPVLKGEHSAELPPEDTAEATPSMPGSGTVLIVDDEEGIQALAVNLFKALGYKALTAADGVEGLTTLKDHIDEISLVLLDITMPRMDGTEAYGHMRNLKSDLPIVICSGYSEEDISSRFIKDEKLLFLHKPYTLEQVARKVAQAFDSNAAP